MKRRELGVMGPLHFAARDGEQEMVEFLLTHGADVNAPADDGWTPLHFAAAGGHTFVAELLLDKGAKASATDAQGQTPLDLAAAYDRSSVIDVIRRYESRGRPRRG